MGVSGLWDLLSPVGYRVSNEHVHNKVLAIDVSIWLTQFIKAMRDAEGATLRNAHLLGVFRRCLKLLYLAVRPVLVFDGETPALKRRTLAQRSATRERHAAKLRRIAEKLLLNQLKQTALASVATNSNLRKRLGSNSRRVETSALPASAANERPPPDPTRSDADYEITPALQPAGEATPSLSEANDTNPSSDLFGAFVDDLEDLDDDDDAIALPANLDLIDEDTLLDMPANMQAKLLKQIKAHHRAQHREHMLREKSNPAAFSRAQISGFLRNTALNRRISSVRNAINDHNGASRRIASDSARAYVLEEFDDDNPQTNLGTNQDPDLMDSGSEDELGKQKTNSRSQKNQQPPDILARIRRQKEGPRFGLNHPKKASDSGKYSHERSGVGWASKALGMSSGFALGQHELEHVPSRKYNNSEENSDVSDLDTYDVMGHAEPNIPLTDGILETANKENKDDNSDDDVEWEDGTDDQNVHAPVVKLPEEQTKLVDTTGIGTGSEMEEEPAMIDLDEPVGEENEPAMLDLDEPTEPKEQSSILDADQPVDSGKAPELLNLDDPCYGTHNTSNELEKLKTDTGSDALQSGGTDEQFIMVSGKDTDSSPQGAMKFKKSDSNVVQIDGDTVDTKMSNKPVVHQKQTSTPTTTNVSQVEETILGETETLGTEEVEDEILPRSPREESEDEILPRSPRKENNQPQTMQNGASSRASIPQGTDEEDRDMQMAIALSMKEGQGGTVGDHKGDKKQEASRSLSISGEAEIVTRTAAEKSEVYFRKTARAERESEGTGEEEAEIIPAAVDTTPTDGPDVSREEIAKLQQELQAEARDMRKEKAAHRSGIESVSDEMYAETRDLLKLFGIPYLQAPTEAEAQCAFLNMHNVVDGIITEDSDTFLFGAKTVYRQLFSNGNFAEAYDVKDISKSLGLGREELIRLAYLLGSDYTCGVRGVGVVNAMEVLEAFPGADGLVQFREWTEKVTVFDEEPDEDTMKGTSLEAVRKQFCWKHRNVKRNWEIRAGFPNPTVFDAYLKPEVDESKEKFKWGRVNFEGLAKFCWEKFGWEHNRFENSVGPLRLQLKEREGQQQSRIDEFFKPHRFAKIRSERLQHAVRGIVGDEAEKLVAPKPPKPPPKRKRNAVSYIPQDLPSDEEAEMVRVLEEVEKDLSAKKSGSVETAKDTSATADEAAAPSTRATKRRRRNSGERVKR